VKKLSSRKEAVVAYRSYYMPKFEYPLPVTTMSKVQLDSIADALRVLQTKCRNTLRFIDESLEAEGLNE